MKYLISESRLEELITDYFDETFPIGEISWTNPIEEFEDGTEGEDPNRLEFYLGDYGDDNTIFRWYGCEYFREGSHARKICPEVVVEGPYDRMLNSYFSDNWEEPFRKWFIEKFNLPVKTVSFL